MVLSYTRSPPTRTSASGPWGTMETQLSAFTMEQWEAKIFGENNCKYWTPGLGLRLEPVRWNIRNVQRNVRRNVRGRWEECLTSLKVPLWFPAIQDTGKSQGGCHLGGAIFTNAKGTGVLHLRYQVFFIFTRLLSGIWVVSITCFLFSLQITVIMISYLLSFLGV